MSRQPPTIPNDDQQFENEIQAIENAMNSMMQGAFSMMFKSIFDTSSGSSIFEQPAVATTIFDGRNIEPTFSARITETEEDEFGGNDFKRLANKRKQNRFVSDSGVVVAENTTSDSAATTPASEIVKSTIYNNSETSNNVNAAAGSIFNLLFHTPEVLFGNRDENSSLVIQPQHDQANNNTNNNWSFTSTSQRTSYKPDGTQETIITKKTNGVTETIRLVRYPDGRTEEVREKSNDSSFWNRLLGR